MKKFNTGLLIIVFVVGALLYYAYLSGKDGTDSDTTKEPSEISKLLAKDLTTDYPKTPREVVKLYSRITVCFYDEERSDEDIEKLADMSLMMFDEELAAKNPKDEYLKSLKSTIAEFAQKGRKIREYTVQGTDTVEKYTLEGREYAKIRVMYKMNDIKENEKEDTGFLSGCGKGRDTVHQYYTTYEDFLLRKDANGAWKILVWQVPDIDDGMEEGVK